MSKAFLILGFAVLGAAVGGFVGFVSANSIASIFFRPAGDSLEGVIWMLVGAFWGALAGCFGGVLLALYHLGIGGDG